MKKIKQNRSERVGTQFTKSDMQKIIEFAEDYGNNSIFKAVELLTIKGLSK
ncbi:hypothetical protein NGI46_25965 [Peribacillus butanolivorans]|uniref:hypothetical protein n=1 Tax=Peribacillus butanolivorans TaxID=421767 RepID=UPI000A829635|nr:hypothetical protein [Peribacillus butanolivorans]MCO0600772.1 hypothetical protein [Peribacillus butanolivorans]